MAKGVPHALSGRRPAKPIIRPQRPTAKQAAAAAAEAAQPVAPKVVKAVEAPKVVEAPKAPKVVEVVAAPKAVEAAKPPLHLLDGSVSSLKEALDTGDHDAHLDALLDAEQAGKGRKTALDALSERRG